MQWYQGQHRVSAGSARAMVAGAETGRPRSRCGRSSPAASRRAPASASSTIAAVARVIGAEDSALEQKHGRILSAANEARIRGARDALDTVLAQLETP